MKFDIDHDNLPLGKEKRGGQIFQAKRKLLFFFILLFFLFIILRWERAEALTDEEKNNVAIYQKARPSVVNVIGCERWDLIHQTTPDYLLFSG